MSIALDVFRKRKKELGIKSDAPKIWEPNDGPQEMAYNSEADILGYGGSGGGGKTDLLIGLAGTRHNKSVIFRRVFPNLRSIIERSRDIFNPGELGRSDDSYNESLHRWQFSNGRMLEFEACQYEKDKEKQRGRPRDFYGFDEVTEFTRSQVEFIIAWLRSTEPGQKCRVVMTFNPPTDASGEWVTDYFLPWLAYLYPDIFSHSNPAEPGELRWYATIDGIETECKNGDTFDHNSELIKPLSRTFIPAKLEDNPYLNDTNYRSVLQSLPEPLRSQMLYGNFGLTIEDDIWQVIPTHLIQAAMNRWQPNDNKVKLTALGCDIARGGKDATVIAKRYGNWWDEIISIPGAETYDGPTAATIIEQQIKDDCICNIDIIGWGASAYDIVKVYHQNTNGVNVAAKGIGTDRSGKYGFVNKRAELHWRFREMLEDDPDIAIPNNAKLKKDLSSARYKITTRGIQIESKDEIKKRLG